MFRVVLALVVGALLLAPVAAEAAPELYAVTEAGEPEPIPLANRVQAWTVGARWALEHRWDGRLRPA